jgi:hypothetical protein
VIVTTVRSGGRRLLTMRSGAVPGTPKISGRSQGIFILFYFILFIDFLFYFLFRKMIIVNKSRTARAVPPSWTKISRPMYGKTDILPSRRAASRASMAPNLWT